MYHRYKPANTLYNEKMKEAIQIKHTQTGNHGKDRKKPLLSRSEEFPADNHNIPQNFKERVQNEPLLTQVVQNIEQVLWLREINSERIIYVSPTFETVWGRSCESLYADPEILIESVHPEDRVQVMAPRFLSGYKPVNLTYRIIRPDGSQRWIFARTFLLQSGTGEPGLLFCIAQDITDQKQVELALHKTLDRTREQVNLSRKMSLARKSEAVLKVLMSAHELRSSRRAALLLFDDPAIGPAHGVELMSVWLSSQDIPPWLSESNLYEEPAFWDLFHPKRTVVITGISSDARLKPPVRDLLLEGQIKTLVILPLVAAGVWRGCLVVYYGNEHFINKIEQRLLEVLVDQAAITLYNLQLLEVEEKSRHEAEQANEIKTKFLAMISHELRTPLTSIVGFTTTLLAEDVGWEPDEQRDFIQTIQREANRLQELIDRLLDLTRLEAAILPISMKSNSLKEVLDDALPQLNSLTSDHTLTIHLPASLPPIYADANRIAQVFVNLVRNSSKYSPTGTEITISASVRGGFIQVNVSDQGPGIPQAEQKRVFEAFRRGHDVENGWTQGAGLGLAICKGIVEAHGGRIWIKKKTLQGTTISFTIPLVTENNPAIPAAEES